MYASQSDVEALNPKQVYGATTSPTATELALLITQISNEIDSVLSAQGYVVPVTTPAYFKSHLAYLNALGAGALAEGGMFPSTTGMGETSHWSFLLKLYRWGLDKLRSGEVPLDLPRSSTSVSAASYATVQTTYDVYPEPKFRMESSDKDF